MRTECVGPLLGTSVTSAVFESKDEPTQMTKAVIYNYILYYIQENYTLQTHMQKCSQLKTVFFQTLGYSSVTQN